MNTHDLDAFIAVVETGSIVAASVRLNLTQPGVTRRIQNLEDALGVPLLDRTAKPLRPTAAGREAYEQGRRVLGALADLAASVAPAGTEMTGEFRVGVMAHLSEAALSAPLDALREAYPRLMLRVASGWSPQLVEQLQRNALDAAAVCLPEGVTPPDGLAADDLGPQSVLLVASPRLGVPGPARLTDLAGFPWVVSESGCGFRRVIRRRFEAERLPFTVAIEASNSDLRLSLVARGLGVGVVAPGALVRSRWRDEVAIIDTVDFRPQVRAWMLHRVPASRLAQPIALFRDTLRDTLAEGPAAPAQSAEAVPA